MANKKEIPFKPDRVIIGAGFKGSEIIASIPVKKLERKDLSTLIRILTKYEK